MIKINLLGDETVVDYSGRFFVAGYVASLVLVAAAFLFLGSSLTSSIDDLNAETKGLEQKLATLQETTKKVRSLEQKRKELNDKLVTIATLKRSKTGPVRILDDLNLAVPERAWLVSVKEASGLMTLAGLALDDQTVASFMKTLEESNYFLTVDLLHSKQVDKGGVKIKEFILQAKVSYAGASKPKEPAAETKPANQATAEVKTPKNNG